MADDLDKVIVDGIRAWLGEKVKRLNILNQNGANLVYTHGQDMAKKLQLPASVRQNITPFPATHIIAVEQPEPERPTLQATPLEPTPLWRKALPWVLAAGTGIGGLAAGSLLLGDKAPPVVEQGEGEVGFTVE